MRIAAALCCLLGLLLLAPACDNPERISAFAVHRAGHGTAKLYDASFDETWAAAHVAFREERIGTIEEHLWDSPSEPFVITNPPASKAPGVPDQVGVWFLPEGPRRTLVKVVVMSGVDSTAGIVGPDESSMQRDIGKAIAQLRREEWERRAPPP
jgi:hypothetical protein